MTLTDFLLARIAEDEAAARAATPGPWSFEWDQYDHTVLAAEPHPQSVHVTETGYDLSSRWVAETSYDDQSSTTYNSVADGHHIARHNPARVLRECEAKRQILERHQPTEVWTEATMPLAEGDDMPDPDAIGRALAGGEKPWGWEDRTIKDEDGKPVVFLDPVEARCTHDIRFAPWPCPDVLIIAAVYADHPDYLPEWRPTD